MKHLILALIPFFVMKTASAAEQHCIEKSDVEAVEFYYGNLLMVTTPGPDYILMTEGCDDLSEANRIELRSSPEDNSSICKLDSVVLLDETNEPYSKCLISEVLKEEQPH